MNPRATLHEASIDEGSPTDEDRSRMPSGGHPDTAPSGRDVWFPPPGDIELARCRARLMANLLSDAPTEQTRIGRFVVLERLGEGGMGVVYAAYDPELDRRVAVKVLRQALDSESVRTRLRREAQAMAKLSHPNVAQVFEVGVHEIPTSASPRPDAAAVSVDAQSARGVMFVAMEFVRGQTLRKWCQAADRSWREVVALYLQAARGLAAAHAAGLVHRDFKPDNAVVGSDGRVRVIDFGLVSLDGRARELMASILPIPNDDALASPLTHGGAIMGTPAYMAAEQFVGDAVTAKSDQFAFSVTLWEGLFGERPFAGKTATELMAAVSAGRIRSPKRTDVPAWVRAVLVRGLAVIPADRHASMDALVEALLDDPARRRRKWLALAGTSVAVAGLAAGFAIDRELDRRACADEGASIDQVWNDDARFAVRSGLVATGVAYAPDTIERVLPRLDAYAATWSQLREDTCRSGRVDHDINVEILARAAECFDEQRDELGALVGALATADATVVEAAVTGAARLSDPAFCTNVAALAGRVPRATDAATRMQLADLRRALAVGNGLGSAGRYAQAEAAATAVLAEAESLEALPLVAAAQIAAGQWAALAGEHGRAAELLAKGVDAALVVGDDELAARGVIELVTASTQGAEYDKAEWWTTIAQPLLTRLGDEHSLLRASMLSARGNLEQARGHYVEARADFVQTLEIRERELGPDHPDVATALHNVANSESEVGELSQMQALLERSLEIRERALGSGHPQVAETLVGLGNVAFNSGEHARALPLYERALAVQQRSLGEDHPDLAYTLTNLATTLIWLEEYAQAATYIERAIEIRRRRLGPAHPAVASSLNALASIRFETGDLAAAEPLLLEALAITEKALGAEHEQVGRVLTNLGKLHRVNGDLVQARARFERALAVWTKTLAPDHRDVAHLQKELDSLSK